MAYLLVKFECGAGPFIVAEQLSIRTCPSARLFLCFSVCLLFQILKREALPLLLNSACLLLKHAKMLMLLLTLKVHYFGPYISIQCANVIWFISMSMLKCINGIKEKAEHFIVRTLLEMSKQHSLHSYYSNNTK